MLFATISPGDILFKWACVWGRLLQVLIAFLRLLLLEYWGVVLKRTEMFVCGGETLHLLPLDSSGQLNVLGHDGDSLCMDGVQVGILEQPYKIGLCCLLKT